MGFIVNHKKVLRLTRKLGVLSFVRPTRKYNSYKGEIGKIADNAFMESFFGVLKSEMYYGFENTFKNKYELKEAIIDYIKYYNEERIKLNLGGLSPVNYRKINRNKYK